MLFKLVVVFSLIALASASPRRLPRIANGNAVKPGQYPYHVSLYYEALLPFSPIAFCGGAILNNQWILTAAYCALSANEGGFIVVKAGNIYYKDPSENEQQSKVAKIIVHEKYEDPLGPNDIALLKLETPLKFNEFVAPLQLPEAEALPTGAGVITGHGSTTHMSNPQFPDVLQAATLPIIDNEKCLKAMDDVVGETGELNLVDETRFCTGATSNNQGYCLHDTGSPLVVEKDGKNIVTGIATFGFAADCTTPGLPSVYSRVSAFNDWIQEKISNN